MTAAWSTSSCSSTMNIITVAKTRSSSSMLDWILAEPSALSPAAATNHRNARRIGVAVGSPPWRRCCAVSHSTAISRNSTASRLEGSRPRAEVELVAVLPAPLLLSLVMSRAARSTSISATYTLKRVSASTASATPTPAASGSTISCLDPAPTAKPLSAAMLAAKKTATSVTSLATPPGLNSGLNRSWRTGGLTADTAAAPMVWTAVTRAAAAATRAPPSGSRSRAAGTTARCAVGSRTRDRHARQRAWPARNGWP